MSGASTTPCAKSSPCCRAWAQKTPGAPCLRPILAAHPSASVYGKRAQDKRINVRSAIAKGKACVSNWPLSRVRLRMSVHGRGDEPMQRCCLMKWLAACARIDQMKCRTQGVRACRARTMTSHPVSWEHLLVLTRPKYCAPLGHAPPMHPTRRGHCMPTPSLMQTQDTDGSNDCNEAPCGPAHT